MKSTFDFTAFLVFVSLAKCVDARSAYIYSNYKKIKLVNETTEDIYAHPGTGGIVDIAYNPANKYLYWSDITLSKISRVYFDPSTKQVLNQTDVVTTDIYSPEGIAVDYFEGHIYWIDTGSKRLSRTSMDGVTDVLINETLERPRAVALHMDNKLIFFSDWGSSPKIERCNYDGSERMTITNNRFYVHYPNGLAIYENKLYWCDNGLKAIMSSELDGSGVTLVFEGNLLVGLYGIAMDNEYIRSTTDLGVVSLGREGAIRLGSIDLDDPSYGIKMLIDDKDICFSYTLIEHQEKRSTNYTYQQIDEPISDDNVTEGWFRVKSQAGEKIPTYPPGINKCGTKYPIWINGSYPDVGMSTVNVCMQTSTNDCEVSWPIHILSCLTGFYIYWLKPSLTESAYCFGQDPVLCDDGLSSETGYYPGCVDSYPDVNINVGVSSELVYGQLTDGRFGNLTAFRCNFNATDNYFYDVYCYIDGVDVTNMKNKAYDQLNETDLLQNSWRPRFSMNMNVVCSVRVKSVFNGIPSPHTYSDVFKAGLYPTSDNYEVEEDSSIIITFIQTVPVGCLDGSSCKAVYFNLYSADDKTDCTPNKRGNTLIRPKIRPCGLVVKSGKTNTSVSLEIRGYSDNKYNQGNRVSFVQLSSGYNTDALDPWSNVSIRDIRITVVDRDTVISNRQCQSINDPHIRTFDGTGYDYMGIGVFIMYKNDNGPFEVQLMFTNCGLGYGVPGSSCNCGIAVRSGSSLFVFRLCKKYSRTDTLLLPQAYVQWLNCDDNDMVVDKNHNILLPSGTKIVFTVDSAFIRSVTITPSVHDIQNTRGLCGTLSNPRNTLDDLIVQSGGVTSNLQDFGDSWKVTDPKNSFFQEEVPAVIKEHVPSYQDYVSSYCNCANGGTFSNNQTDQFPESANIVDCANAGLFCKGTSKSFITNCPIPSRKKRSVFSPHHIYRRSVESFDSDDVIDFPTLQYEDDQNENITSATFRNGWTYETAYEVCKERLESISTLYTDMLGEQNDFYLDSCVKDIELTADTTFVKDTIGAMQTLTLEEITKNETLAIIKTDEGNQTVLESIGSQLCPENCSTNGICELGVCSCFDGYTGLSCSEDLYKPPQNITVPSGGLCGTRRRACRKTNIYGYFSSTDVWCLRKHFSINENGTQSPSNGSIIKAVFRNNYMVSCDLHSNRRKRETTEDIIAEGYEISLSNDGFHFGDSVTVIVYDEDCYNCSTTGLACFMLESCPYLHTTEVPTTQNPDTSPSSTLVSEPTLDRSTIKLTETTVAKSSEKQITDTEPLTTVTERSTFDDIKTLERTTLGAKDKETASTTENNNDTSASMQTRNNRALTEETTLPTVPTISDFQTEAETELSSTEKQTTHTKLFTTATEKNLIDEKTTLEVTTRSETTSTSMKTELTTTGLVNKISSTTESLAAKTQTTQIESELASTTSGKLVTNEPTTKTYRTTNENTAAENNPTQTTSTEDVTIVRDTISPRLSQKVSDQALMIIGSSFGGIIGILFVIMISVGLCYRSRSRKRKLAKQTTVRVTDRESDVNVGYSPYWSIYNGYSTEAIDNEMIFTSRTPKRFKSSYNYGSF